jgi:hypothetical protein
MAGSRIMNRWLVVLGTMMIIPIVGAVYAWSIYHQPLAELLAARNGVSPESLTAPLNFVFSLIILFFAAGAIPGSMIQDRIGIGFAYITPPGNLQQVVPRQARCHQRRRRGGHGAWDHGFQPH